MTFDYDNEMVLKLSLDSFYLYKKMGNDESPLYFTL